MTEEKKISRNLRYEEVPSGTKYDPKYLDQYDAVLQHYYYTSSQVKKYNRMINSLPGYFPALFCNNRVKAVYDDYFRKSLNEILATKSQEELEKSKSIISNSLNFENEHILYVNSLLKETGKFFLTSKISSYIPTMHKFVDNFDHSTTSNYALPTSKVKDEDLMKEPKKIYNAVYYSKNYMKDEYFKYSEHTILLTTIACMFLADNNADGNKTFGEYLDEKFSEVFNDLRSYSYDKKYNLSNGWFGGYRHERKPLRNHDATLISSDKTSIIADYLYVNNSPVTFKSYYTDEMVDVIKKMSKKEFRYLTRVNTPYERKINVQDLQKIHEIYVNSKGKLYTYDDYNKMVNEIVKKFTDNELAIKQIYLNVFAGRIYQHNTDNLIDNIFSTHFIMEIAKNKKNNVTLEELNLLISVATTRRSLLFNRASNIEAIEIITKFIEEYGYKETIKIIRDTVLDSDSELLTYKDWMEVFKSGDKIDTSLPMDINMAVLFRGKNRKQRKISRSTIKERNGILNEEKIITLATTTDS